MRKAKRNESRQEIRQLEKWLKSYHPEELFDDNGEMNTVPKFYHDTYNFTVSPIVTLSEDGVLLDKWDNFRIDLLNRYKE